MTSTAPTDAQVLELASRRYNRPGARDRAAQDELGLSGVAFAARLLHIVEAPPLEVAEAYGPLLARLRRVLTVERARRSARRVA